MSRLYRAAGAALLLSLAATLPAAAQSTKTPAKEDATKAAEVLLPGGASSLQESFEDWTVVCALPGGHKTCSLSQTQTNQKTQQRVLAMELTAGDKGMAAGVLAMPFGLSLEKGLALQIGDETATTTLTFQTCLPVGCIVPLKFDDAMLTKLRGAKQIKLTAYAADTGQPVVFNVSLKGFGPALARVRSLI